MPLLQRGTLVLSSSLAGAVAFPVTPGLPCMQLT